VLYLDRPGSKSVRGAVLCGRFGYSDLKEAALSGAAELWALNGVELGSDVSRAERLVCRELLDWELMGTDGLGDMASLCCQAKTVAARMT
jgi:hypothetical protein